MTLRDFLQERQHDSQGGAEQRRKIEAYSIAVKRLMGRFREVLRPYDALAVEEWLPLLKEHAVPYNAPALTISFGDDQIDIQPKGAFVMDSEGRVAMTRGVREVHLDWPGATTGPSAGSLLARAPRSASRTRRSRISYKGSLHERGFISSHIV
jgi:hypothetical protein